MVRFGNCYRWVLIRRMTSKKQPSQPSLGDWTSERATLANTSQLARAAGLDRATVVKRLKAAGVQPVRERSREKEYEVSAATAALSNGGGNGHAGAVDSAGYHKARTQKTTAEAARILLKLQRERNELAP